MKYLRYKSEITAKMSTVASLEEELADLKEDNDAYYSQVTSNVDLNKIKQIALGRLGMKYPSDDQTVTYSTSGNSYVRQYQDNIATHTTARNATNPQFIAVAFCLFFCASLLN